MFRTVRATSHAKTIRTSLYIENTAYTIHYRSTSNVNHIVLCDVKNVCFVVIIVVSREREREREKRERERERERERVSLAFYLALLIFRDRLQTHSKNSTSI